MSDIIRILELEYYAAQAANPYSETTLVEFLQIHKVPNDEIWEHFPEEAEEAGIPIPEWY